MGADLYIKKMPRGPQYTGFELSDRAIDLGYFRDCYNQHGLFAFLSKRTGEELSWWQMCANKNWFNKSGDLTVVGAQELREKLLPYLRAAPK